MLLVFLVYEHFRAFYLFDMFPCHGRSVIVLMCHQYGQWAHITVLDSQGRKLYPRNMLKKGSDLVKFIGRIWGNTC